MPLLLFVLVALCISGCAGVSGKPFSPELRNASGQGTSAQVAGSNISTLPASAPTAAAPVDSSTPPDTAGTTPAALQPVPPGIAIDPSAPATTVSSAATTPPPTVSAPAVTTVAPDAPATNPAAAAPPAPSSPNEPAVTTAVTNAPATSPAAAAPPAPTSSNVPAVRRRRPMLRPALRQQPQLRRPLHRMRQPLRTVSNQCSGHYSGSSHNSGAHFIECASRCDCGNQHSGQ